MTRIPLRYTDKSGEMALLYIGYGVETDPFAHDEALRRKLIDSAAGAVLPLLEFEGDDIVYGVFADAADCYVIAGPICLSQMGTDDIARYAAAHNIPEGFFPMKHRTLDVFCAYMTSVYHVVTGKTASESEIAINGSAYAGEKASSQMELQKYVLDNTEQEVSRFSYADEVAFMAAVREGRPQEIIARGGNMPELEKVGKFARSSFKQFEYLACSSFTLATRAAIDGGLDPLTAYGQSDLAKQRLEQCKKISDIMNLSHSVMVDFATRVKDVREQKSKISYIEKCKSYIDNHLNVNFHLADVAGEVGVNGSYLSRRFSQEVGMGIRKYTRMRRIEAAANMLKYTDESITTVANYLCFPSQSHFGKVFREQMGVSPQKYRDRERLVDF